MSRHPLFGLATLCALVLTCAALTPARADAGLDFQINLPMPNQVVTGSKLPISVSFQSENPVVRYDAYLDSSWLLGVRVRNPISVGSLPPVEADLSEVNAKPGKHTLYIRLFDTQGRVTKHEQTISYQPIRAHVDITPPRVRIVSPRNGEQISAATTIQIDSSDESGIKWVMVFIDGQMRAMMNQPPFTMPWNPMKDQAASGPHTLLARALDPFDNEGVSETVTVNVMKTARTTLEDNPFTPTTSDTPLGIIVPFSQPSLSMGPGYDRPLYANVIAPFSLSVAGTGVTVPDLSRALARQTTLAPAPGELLAVLPPRLVPQQLVVGTLDPLGSLSITNPPALAMASGSTPRRTLAAGQWVPVHGTVLLPAEGQIHERTLIVADQPRAETALRVAKLMPSNTPDALPRETVVQTVATATQPGVGSTPGRVTAVATVPSVADRNVALPGARSLPTRPEALPTVQMAWLPPTIAKRSPSAAQSNASTYAETQPSPQVGLTLTALESSVDPPSLTVMARGGFQADPLAVDTVFGPLSRENRIQDRPALSDLTRLAHLPYKDMPNRTLMTAAEETPALGVQVALTPRVLSTGRHPAFTPGGQPYTLLVTGTDMPSATDTPGERTVLVGDYPRATATRLPGKMTPANSSRPQVATPVQVARTQDVPLNPGAQVGKPYQVNIPVTRQDTTTEIELDIQAPYTVKTQGETVEKIAANFAIPPEELIKMNPGISPERPLQVGDQLRVPRPEARLFLDNSPLTGGPAPFLTNGYSMVPFRVLVEAKGGVVVWLPKTREVNAWANNTFMGLRIGQREAQINAQTFVLPVAATLRDARTMVPLRYMMTALKLNVEYNPASGTYYLVSKATP